MCWRCRRAQATCLCATIRPFESVPLIVGLLHPREAKNTVGTARIVRLGVANSIWIEGTGSQLDQNPRLREIVEDPSIDTRVLFPGPFATPLSEPHEDTRRLAVLVIDGTWPQARKMIRCSEILSRLPQCRLDPRRPSNYRIRLQPAALCLSTLEAVHAVLDEVPGAVGPGRPHDNLIVAFERMIDRQIAEAAAKRAPRHVPD